jgi:hypothetical protein
MANITGYYEFHRACPSQNMQIQFNSAGKLIESYIDKAPINGNYDPTTNVISFNDARQPGATLFVTFYTGYVMPSGDGGVCAMAGTYHELELVLEEGDTAESRIVVPPPIITEVHGAWYAVWTQNIIT